MLISLIINFIQLLKIKYFIVIHSTDMHNYNYTLYYIKNIFLFARYQLGNKRAFCFLLTEKIMIFTNNILVVNHMSVVCTY